MIATHAWTYVGDAASVLVMVGSLVAAMLVAARQERRATARRAWRAGPAPSNVRRIPR